MSVIRQKPALQHKCMILLAALLMAGCSALPGGRSDRAPASQPTHTGAPQLSPGTAQCLSDLGSTGASFSLVPDRYPGGGCTVVGAVQLSSLITDERQVQISNIGPVTCPVSRAFAGWARFGADRAARQILGSPLRTIETFGSYSCRNVAGTNRRSAHSTASAIDVSAFVLADGRRIVLKQHWNGGTSKEREFLRVVQESACKRFDTVLGPQYNAAHADHFHLEGVAGTGRGFCR